MIPVNNIIRSATRTSEDPLNILWLPHNGIFEHLVCSNTHHNFFGGLDLLNDSWDTSLFPPTSNFNILDRHNSFSMDVDFDLVVCNSRMGQLNQAKVLSSVLHIPLLLIEHALPPNIMKAEDIHLKKQEQQAEYHIVTSDIINTAWQSNDRVIPYGIQNLKEDAERVDRILLVGKFKPQEHEILKQLRIQSSMPVEILGDNPGLSEPCSYQQLIEKLNTSKYFLNVNNTKITPLLTLMAMSAGCVPVSNINPLLKDVITEDTSFTFTDQLDMIRMLNDLHNKDAIQQSENASKTIQEKFNVETAAQSWDQIFHSVCNHVYKR